MQYKHIFARNILSNITCNANCASSAPVKVVEVEDYARGNFMPHMQLVADASLCLLADALFSPSM